MAGESELGELSRWQSLSHESRYSTIRQLPCCHPSMTKQTHWKHITITITRTLGHLVTYLFTCLLISSFSSM